MADSSSITQLLSAAQKGDASAMDRLFPLIYDELRRRAHLQRAGSGGLATMNTTALVHEAYIKLADQNDVHFENRLHFLAVAAKAMRHVYLDYAKRKNAKKRGAGVAHVSLDMVSLAGEEIEIGEEDAEKLIALDKALELLAESHPRQAQVVEYRFFGGLTVEDTAAILDTSPATVKRDWTVAQSWLYEAMKAND